MHFKNGHIVEALKKKLPAVNPDMVRRWTEKRLLRPAFKNPGERGHYYYTLQEVARFLDEELGFCPKNIQEVVDDLKENFNQVA